jgi:hypothetical protein
LLLIDRINSQLTGYTMTDDYRLQLLNKLTNEGYSYMSMSVRIFPESFQASFLSWHHQVIYQLESFGNSFSDLIAQMKKNNEIDYSDTNYIREIVGALMGARGILESQLQTKNGQTIIDNSIQPLEKALNELMNICFYLG